jgi:hypothetical protein
LLLLAAFLVQLGLARLHGLLGLPQAGLQPLLRFAGVLPLAFETFELLLHQLDLLVALHLAALESLQITRQLGMRQLQLLVCAPLAL